MPVLKASASDYTTVVKSLANAGAAVSNPQGSRSFSKKAVPFVNTSFASSLIRFSSFLTVGPTRNPIVQSVPVDPNYTTYVTSLLLSSKNSFNSSVTRDAFGNFYGRLAYRDYNLYKVAPDGTEIFIAGNGITNNSTLILGSGAAAQFTNYAYIFVPDSLGNLYSVDVFSPQILKITPNGNVTSYAGTGTAGYNDGPAATATFSYPLGITIDSSNTLYVSELSRKTIRKITTGGQVSTLTFSATFNPYFYKIAVDSSGVIYAIDNQLHRVYKITPTGPTTADIALLAGSTQGYANGQGSAVQFYFDSNSGICVDAFGNVYVGDSNNGSIRKISPSGNVITIAGTGVNASAGQETNIQLYYPYSISVDANGIIYILSETGYIRKLTPVS